MTYLRPDKKGLGLDAPSPDEPGYFSGRVETTRRPWWVSGRSLAGSLATFVVWTAYAVFRLVQIIGSSHVSGTDWLMLALPAGLALFPVPAIVYYARQRLGWVPTPTADKSALS
jgi:hypothetical protein